MRYGVQRFLGNDRNLLATDALITADSVRTATATARPETPVRQGFGTVALSGAYTGAADTAIDIEIVAGAGAAIPSQPVYSGAGNGTLSTVTVTGLDAQTITVELVSLGTTTAAARCPLGRVAFVAKAAGATGNGITVTVTPDLTIGDALGALPAAVQAGESSWTGPEWDIGQPALNSDGTVPSAALRVVVNGDVGAVYRLYKEWQTDRWAYRVSPPLGKSYPAGATISAVTGDYTVTVKQGATTETYADLTTLYDLLDALTGSALVAVDGVVTDDRLPGGMGLMDIPYRTQAAAQVTSKTGSRAMTEAVVPVTADSTAKTQVVTVECTDNAAVGNEAWSVRSDVSGDLGSAVTGTAFDDTVQFTVPVQTSSSDPFGILLTNVEYAPREIGAPEPLPICIRMGTQGAKATAKTLTLVFKRRSVSECSCNDAAVTGRVIPELLGIENLEVTSALDSEYKNRLTELYDYAAAFIGDNTAVVTTTDYVVSTVWETNYPYIATTRIVPTVANGHFYYITLPAAQSISWSGSGGPGTETFIPRLVNEPAWPTNGEVLRVSLTVEDVYDSFEASYPARTAVANGADCEVLIQDAGLIDRTRYRAADDDIDLMYQILGVLGKCLSLIWDNADARAEWDLVWSDAQSDLTAAAASGSVSNVFLDGGYLTRYQSRCDQILLIADILPGKYEASSAGNTVWRDYGDPYWWEINGGEYLPAFTNRVYHSAKADPETGAPVAAQEFAFAIACACEQRLIEGDTLTITVSAAAKTYAVGDAFTIAVQGGQALVLTGGLTGNDTLTWRVTGSVTPGFNDYALTALEPAYSHLGLGFQIQRGAVPFALGDRWQFAIEDAGKFKWRRDGGAWSAATSIADSVALTAGITASFTRGVAPSFVAGDAFPFTVIQPYAPAHLRAPLPRDDTYQWTGATATLSIDLGTALPLSAVGLLIHSLPSSATITLWGGASAAATDWYETVTWCAGPIVKLFEVRSCRYLRLVLTSATGGSIGWLWIGEPLKLSRHATTCELRREYLMARSSGANPTARALGSGWGCELSWESLTQTDVDGLLALWEDAKAAGDAPIGLLPHYLHPEDAILTGLNDDSLAVTDYFAYQPNEDVKRRLSCTLALRAIPQ